MKYNVEMDAIKDKCKLMPRSLHRYNKCYCGILVHTVLRMLNVEDVVNIINESGKLGIRVPGEVDRDAITGEVMTGNNIEIEVNSDYKIKRY